MVGNPEFSDFCKFDSKCLPFLELPHGYHHWHSFQEAEEALQVPKLDILQLVLMFVSVFCEFFEFHVSNSFSQPIFIFIYIYIYTLYYLNLYTHCHFAWFAFKKPAFFAPAMLYLFGFQGMSESLGQEGEGGIGMGYVEIWGWFPFPNAKCMVYLHTFTPKTTQM